MSILTRRTPADQGVTSVTRQMPQLVKYGYVVVEVERRGLGACFGARRGYNDRTEARDAFEVTEWLARQPWSTGKVGVQGCSNTGDAAMHAASLAPPALKAVMAGCFSWNKYDGFRQHPWQYLDVDVAMRAAPGVIRPCTLSRLAPVIPLAGAGMVRALEAVMGLFPLDAYVAQPIAFMHVGGEAPDYLSALQREAVASLSAKGWATPAQFEPMERFAFYDRAKSARAVVHTGELQPYANFILKKGVLGEALQPRTVERFTPQFARKGLGVSVRHLVVGAPQPGVPGFIRRHGQAVS